MPNAPTVAPEAPQTALEWLGVSEVAFALRVSERTIRRKCEAGKMAARRVATPGGICWQIDPAEVRTLRTGAARGADTQNEAGKENTLEGADTADRVRTGAAIPSDSLTAHLLEENRRLWAALEAAQQSEAVTKAALREALRAMPKALPAPSPEEGCESVRTQKENAGGDFGTNRDGHASARSAPQHAPNGEAGTYGAKASSGPQNGGNGGESLSYGDIADMLEAMERELNK